MERKGDTFLTEKCLALRTLCLGNEEGLEGPLWGWGSPVVGGGEERGFLEVVRLAWHHISAPVPFASKRSP